MTRVDIAVGTYARVDVEAGQLLYVTDLIGSQIADWLAFNTADDAEYISGAETLNFQWRARLAVGDTFFSSKRRPMFEIVADEAGGVHDMTHAPCSREYYRWHTGQSEHANCHDNLRSAMDELAMTHRNVPTPVNLFQNTPMGANGWTENLAGVTRPGDTIVLRAMMDSHCMIAACPDDVSAPDDAPAGSRPGSGGAQGLAIRVEIT